MKQRILTVLSRTDERLVAGAMLLLAALLAFEGWHLVLRAPLAQYRQLGVARVALSAATAAAPRTRDPSVLAAEVREVVEKLDGELRVPYSDDQLTAFLMTELDQSAAANGVKLKGVKPGARSTVASFQEISYDVAAEGSYLTVCRWLVQLESAMGGRAGVRELTVKAAEKGEVVATLNLALYRSREKAQPK